MAATGQKKKQKLKGKTLNLNEFLANDADQSQAFKKPVSWADEMEEAEDDVGDFNSYGMPKRVNRAVLPTAPKAARGPDVDLASVPMNPPYTAFLGNLPYDIDEVDIEEFFKGLSVSNIRLPTGQGRLKGFGYAEFGDRQSLLDALALNEGQIRNRQIRIDLAEHNQQGESKSDWRRRDDGQPEAPNRSDQDDDWRRGSDRGPPAPARDDRYGNRNDRFGSGGGGDRFGDRGGDRYGDRGGDRYGDRGGDRYSDRGGDRYGDRGGDRYGDRGGDRYGDRGGDRYGDRGGDRYGDRRFGDRDSDRDGGRRSFGSGFRGDDREDRFSSRDIRYTRDGQRDDRYTSREERPDSRSYGGREEKSDAAPRDRPRLQLQPRTKPVEAKPEPPKEAAERSSSIFGGAKPVDTAAREREIEERLKRQHEVDHQKVEMEKESREFERSKRLSSSDERRRSDSGGEAPRRERKTSSSSSGKGIRTVMPPPHTGSARVRRESDLDHEEVFDHDEKATSPKTTPPRKEDVKMVAAPAPKENVWQRRKVGQTPASPGNPDSGPTSPTGPTSPSQTTDKPVAPPTSPTAVSPISPPPPKDNAWSRGKPSLVPAEPPRDNPWTKRKQDKPEPAYAGGDDHSTGNRGNTEARSPGGKKPVNSEPAPNAWGRGGSGAAVVSGRGRGTSPDAGPEKPRGGKNREKALPTSIDDMPKYEGDKNKDWTNSNKFSQLMDDGNGQDGSD